MSNINNIPKEYYLQYANKTPEKDVLADTMSLPFQPVKIYPENAKINESEWHNMIIFGENSQALKHLLKLKKEGKLRNPDGSDGVKLVYIDPPFGTGDQYDAKGNVPAYSAKLQGVNYIEFLRKRFILLRELLTEDGTIYVRIDYHFGHYIKIILDEVFTKNNFINEIIVNRGRNMAGARGRKMEVDCDFIFAYSKNEKFIFNDGDIKVQRPVSEIKWTSFLMAGDRNPPERYFLGKKFMPPKGQHFSLIQPKVDNLLSEFHLRVRCRNCSTLYYYSKNDYTLSREMKKKDNRFKFYDLKPGVVFHGTNKLDRCQECNEDKFAIDYLGAPEKKITNIWLDIESYSRSNKYPTENSEFLLERIILASSNKGDICLDCFSGSGTTGAVAEKLERKWIMCDTGKLSIYITQKRLLSLKQKIGNKGKELKPSPFVVYNAGHYNYDLIKKMGEGDYKKFCLELFQCEPHEQNIKGFKVEGIRDSSPVYIHKGKYLTYDFIKSLHATIGSSMKNKMFIIAPSASVKFFENYIEHDKIKYYILRIPYSIIDEIEKKQFLPLKQPNSEKLLNDIVDSVGFDFIESPTVECEYFILKPKDKLIKIAQIEIKKFISNQRSTKEKNLVQDDELSMILIDTNFDGKNFKLTDKFFRDEIKNNIVKFNADLGAKIAVIYIDLYGNEKFELIERGKFKEI